MRVLPTAVLALFLTVLPGTALAQTSETEQFEHGSANYRTHDGPIAFEQYGGGDRQAPCPPPGAPTCSYEAHDFTIDPGEVNGKFHVTVSWANAENDWDVYVYKVKADDTVDQSKPVATSASFGDTDETATLIGIDEPIATGKYRIYVDNWQNSDVDYDWFGKIEFEPWVAPNRGPVAALAAPATAVGGQPVTLDAAGSTDDAGIVNYAWDLDGDGRFETDAGTSPTQQATFAAGRRHVSLRVRDAQGIASFAAHTIEVSPAPAPPQQPPPSANEISLPPPEPGRIALDLASPQRLDAVLARGLRATVECPVTCTITATLRISGRTARRLGLGKRAITIARRERKSTGRSFPRLRLKPGLRVRRAMRGRDEVPATLRIRVVAEGLAAQTYKRPVRIVG